MLCSRLTVRYRDQNGRRRRWTTAGRRRFRPKSAQAEAQQKRAALHKLSGDLKDSELKLDGIETKRKNYQQKLYQGTVTNAKELSNIEREIEALGRQRSDLDSKVLELMEQVEQAQAADAVAEAEAHRSERSPHGCHRCLSITP